MASNGSLQTAQRTKFTEGGKGRTMMHSSHSSAPLAIEQQDSYKSSSQAQQAQQHFSTPYMDKRMSRQSMNQLQSQRVGSADEHSQRSSQKIRQSNSQTQLAWPATGQANTNEYRNFQASKTTGKADNKQQFIAQQYGYSGMQSLDQADNAALPRVRTKTTLGMTNSQRNLQQEQNSPMKSVQHMTFNESNKNLNRSISTASVSKVPKISIVEGSNVNQSKDQTLMYNSSSSKLLAGAAGDIMNKSISVNTSSYPYQKQLTQVSQVKKDFSIADVTPELAAEIVKHMVLPMFDERFRKETRSKHGGVFSELKLSEQLNQHLSDLSERFDELLGKQEFTQAQLDENKKELRKKQAENELLLKKLYSVKTKQKITELNLAKSVFAQTKVTTEMESLSMLTQLSDKRRGEFADQLSRAQAKMDQAEGEIMTLESTMGYERMHHQVVMEHLQNLESNIKNVSNVKMVTDNMQVHIDKHKFHIQNITAQLTETKKELALSIIEKDKLAKDLKEAISMKQQIEKKLSGQLALSRSRAEEFESKLNNKAEDYSEVFEQLYAKEKICKQLQQEQKKMKQRIIMLKKKKGNVEQTKICKNCGKDFEDSNNFNWSCRTHYSQFSGEMWWCCGKPSQDALGCKFSRHIAKNEDDDEALEDDITNAMKNKRCMCCREYGHTIDRCHKDPNMRTKMSAMDEIERLSTLKDQKALYADTVVSTTQFLKKCVVVKGKEGKDSKEKDQDDDQEPSMEQTSASNPFKRGVMQFEDYNYRLHNPYILIDKKVQGKKKVRLDTKKDDVKIKAIEDAGLPDYEHATIQSPRMSPKAIEDIERQQMEEIERDRKMSKKEKRAMEKAAAKAAKAAGENSGKNSAQNSDTESRKGDKDRTLTDTQEHSEEEKSENEEEEQAKKDKQSDIDSDSSGNAIFFEKEEIDQTRRIQRHDLFQELQDQKQLVLAANKEHNVTEKFPIGKFVPTAVHVAKMTNMIGKTFASRVEIGVDNANKAEAISAMFKNVNQSAHVQSEKKTETVNNAIDKLNAEFAPQVKKQLTQDEEKVIANDVLSQFRITKVKDVEKQIGPREDQD